MHAREEILGEVSSYEECIELVRTNYPEANGVSVSAGGVGYCYAEFGMTESNESESYETAFLECTT
jgi:hypothetical protein